MEAYRKPRLEHVLGDTWCIVTGFCRIPLYMPQRSKAVMIDSGLKDPDRQGILKLLEQEQIRVAALLTSHFHRDHIGNHRAIQEKHGAHVYMTPFTSAMLENTRRPSPVLKESAMQAVPHSGPRESNTEHLFLPTEEAITVAGYTFKILPLPGHSQEHVGFVTPDGVAYLSDTLLSRPILQSVRIPYFTFCREDLEAKASVLEMDYPCYILAHNGVYTNVRELAQENIDNLQEKLHVVEMLAQHWITLEQLAAQVIRHMGGDGDALRKVMGYKRNVQVLVEYLQETGRLDIRARDGFIEYIRCTK